ncbi:hypothetical protein CHN51_04840 [Sphingorhabdus sp. YGSMI21]|nr:hypothetical protein CHN51_04840 [Sphingorhabdus sp. YGSMI21]
MAVNWFEGGRRITNLLQWLVALGFGGAILFTSDPDAVLFETSLPSERFGYSTTECVWPDEQRDANLILFPDGEQREISLCFRTRPDRNIVFLESIADKDEAERGFKKGDPLISFGDTYDDRVRVYISNRVNNPDISPSELVYAQQNLWKRKPRAIWGRTKEMLPFAAGAIGFLWLFSSVIGWIIRGFAGIPSGEDFRPIGKIKDV